MMTQASNATPDERDGTAPEPVPEETTPTGDGIDDGDDDDDDDGIEDDEPPPASGAQ